MQNWGDVGETITLTLTNTSDAQISLGNFPLPPGTSPITSYISQIGSSGAVGVIDYIINTGLAGQTGSASVTASAPASTALCWPMPTMVVTAQ
jgi:hypothetical protein